MKKDVLVILRRKVLVVKILIATSFVAFIAYTDYQVPIVYVSTTGNDRWSGSYPEPLSDCSDGPVATLEKAKELLREKRKDTPNSGGVVLIRGGNYFLKNTFMLEEVDSGINDSPVTWQSYKGEEVNIIGGVPIERL